MNVLDKITEVAFLFTGTMVQLVQKPYFQILLVSFLVFVAFRIIKKGKKIA